MYKNNKKSIFNFNKPETIAQWIIFLAATGIILSSPRGARNFSKELNKYLNDKINGNNSFDSRQLSQALYKLKNRNIINIIDKNNKTIILLTEKGKKKKLEYDIDNIKIGKPDKWDGKWRFLMFDIPESKKNAREAFRNKIIDLGFVRFQKSVWIYPYSCDDEINFIAEIFLIAPYLTLLVVEVDNDKPLKAQFGL